jgi:hypothetical protein
MRRDDAVIGADNVMIKPFALPGLPLRMEPRFAEMDLQFRREGDRIAARWSVVSDSVTWLRDTLSASRDTLGAVGGKPTVRGVMEQLVTRVLTGIHHLELTADVDGEIRKPRLRVRSNLDRALADRLREVVGEEVKRAEVRVRAEVDRIVERETAPIRARVATAREEAIRRVAEAKARIEEEKAELEARLKGLAGGLITG